MRPVRSNVPATVPKVNLVDPKNPWATPMSFGGATRPTITIVTISIHPFARPERIVKAMPRFSVLCVTAAIPVQKAAVIKPATTICHLRLPRLLNSGAKKSSPATTAMPVVQDRKPMVTSFVVNKTLIWMGQNTFKTSQTICIVEPTTMQATTFGILKSRTGRRGCLRGTYVSYNPKAISVRPPTTRDAITRALCHG